MHLAFCKELANGIVSITSAGNWDGLKCQLSKLDHHETEEWDQVGWAWNHFKNGDIISDETTLWRYFNIEVMDAYGVEIFNGRIILLPEIDPSLQ